LLIRLAQERLRATDEPCVFCAICAIMRRAMLHDLSISGAAHKPSSKGAAISGPAAGITRAEDKKRSQPDPTAKLWDIPSRFLGYPTSIPEVWLGYP
jgi:hypothetical protein